MSNAGRGPFAPCTLNVLLVVQLVLCGRNRRFSAIVPISCVTVIWRLPFYDFYIPISAVAFGVKF